MRNRILTTAIIGILLLTCAFLASRLYLDKLYSEAEETTPAESDTEPPETTTTAAPEPRMFAFSYTESNAPLVNQYMGYAPRARITSLVNDNEFSLCFVGLTFREWEPTRGNFDYEYLKSFFELDRNRAEKRRIVFRLSCDSPTDTLHMDIPDWLYNDTGDGEFYNTDIGKGYCPNYNNETFISAHTDAVKALAEFFESEYGSDFVCYVQLGSLGHWGEWHINTSLKTKMPLEEVRLKYVLPWIEAFPDAYILMRRPFTPVKTYGLGLYNDMSGHPVSTETFLDWIENGAEYTQTGEENAIVAVPDQYLYAPIGGELTGSYDYKYLLQDEYEQTQSLTKRSHTTFLGPSYKYDENYNTLYKEELDDLLTHMGYRISVPDAAYSEQNDEGSRIFEISLHNSGVAPLYFKLPLYLYIRDENGDLISKTRINYDIRELAPDSSEKIRVIMNTADFGTQFTVDFAIEDTNQDYPPVQLANSEFSADTPGVLRLFTVRS